MSKREVMKAFPNKVRRFVTKGEKLRTITVRFDDWTFQHIASGARARGVSFATQVRALVDKGIHE